MAQHHHLDPPLEPEGGELRGEARGVGGRLAQADADGDRRLVLELGPEGVQADASREAVAAPGLSRSGVEGAEEVVEVEGLVAGEAGQDALPAGL